MLNAVGDQIFLKFGFNKLSTVICDQYLRDSKAGDNGLMEELPTNKRRGMSNNFGFDPLCHVVHANYEELDIFFSRGKWTHDVHPSGIERDRRQDGRRKSRWHLGYRGIELTLGTDFDIV